MNNKVCLPKQIFLTKSIFLKTLFFWKIREIEIRPIQKTPSISIPQARYSLYPTNMMIQSISSMHTWNTNRFRTTTHHKQSEECKKKTCIGKYSGSFWYIIRFLCQWEFVYRKSFSYIRVTVWLWLFVLMWALQYSEPLQLCFPWGGKYKLWIIRYFFLISGGCSTIARC